MGANVALCPSFLQLLGLLELYHRYHSELSSTHSLDAKSTFSLAGRPRGRCSKEYVEG